MKRWVWTATGLAFGVVMMTGCGDDVPVGHGQQGSGAGAEGGRGGSGGAGATGGAAGRSGAGGAGGSAGEGGTAGRAGAGGAGGSAGEGGMAGRAGAGGAAGQAGAGGDSGSGGGGSCALGGSGTKTRLSSGWPTPRGLALDEDYVYFVNWGHGSGANPEAPSIVRVAKAGGTETVLADAALYPAQASAFAGPDAIAAQGDELYWTAAAGNEVWRMPKAGGTPSALVTSRTDPNLLDTPPAPTAYTFGIDGDALYFARHRWISPGSSFTSGVYRSALADGALSTLAEDTNTVSESAGHAATVTLAGSRVVWAWWHGLTTPSEGALRVAGTDGSSPSTLTTTAQVQGLTVDGASAYYTQAALVMSAPLSGGGSTLLAPLPGVLPLGRSLTTWEGSLYVAFTDAGAACGGVVRLPKAGGPVELLARGERPSYVSADASGVYYTDLEAGEVWRVEP